MKKDYWAVEPDEDSGFHDECSSVAYGETVAYPVQVTGHKTKSWGCFTQNEKDKKKFKKPGNVHEKNALSGWSKPKGNFLQRATKNIIGKTKRLFGNLKQEEDKSPAYEKPLLRFHENHATQVNIILPANSSNSINLDLLDDGKLNFFRDDPLRSPIRKSHMSVSSRESRESHSSAQSRNSFHGMDTQRCSIRGPRDSFFREPRESFSWDSVRFSERQAMLPVLFDFEACDDDDISVSRGELVRVLNKDDEDWWWVENEYRDQGFVPRSFLWPCGCYVCQRFILEKVSNVADRQRSQYSQQKEPEDCYSRYDERTKIVGDRKCTSTWC